MQRRDILTLAAAGAIPGLASAQASSSTLRLVVPFPQGGATDITARVLAAPLSRILGMPVKVDNLPGAGGATGMQAVAKAAADGMTLGVATLSTHGVNPAVYKKLPYDAIKDFVGVTEIVKAPGVLVINPKLIPAKTFAEFVAYLKANPGKVSYATPGNGTIGHMWGAQFLKSTGTEMHHIPYRGSAPAINDVLGGQVPVYFDQVNSSLPHIKSGKVRALAVSWHERLDVLPDVQTYAQAGHPDLNEPSWFGLVAPKNTPAAQVDRVQKAIIAALKDPAVKQRMADQGLYPSGTSSADFTKQIASEVTKMKKLAAASNIQMD